MNLGEIRFSRRSLFIWKTTHKRPKVRSITQWVEVGIGMEFVDRIPRGWRETLLFLEVPSFGDPLEVLHRAIGTILTLFSRCFLILACEGEGTRRIENRRITYTILGRQIISHTNRLGMINRRYF